MKRLLLASFFVANVCAAEVKNPIDAELTACLAKDENYPTAKMVECISVAASNWDKELNLTYQILFKKLDSKAQENLKTSELAWIKYRDLEIKNIDSIFAKIPGTMYIPVKQDKILDLTRARTLELKSYLENLP
jgi:uncharacterized protein YecT (DUF1311 family)